uniref:YLPM1-like spectrin repeat domain-containing protein n=1 Tax=Timema bartmani TaxID=61472 RepID=A0A7R9F0B1_9NEOP|nr:unnamed protein product [Timema bartmani]
MFCDCPIVARGHSRTQEKEGRIVGAANVNCQIQPIISRFPSKVSGNLVSTNYKYSLLFSGSGFCCNLPFLTKRLLGATSNPRWYLEGTKSWNQWGAPGAYTTPSYQAAPAAPPGAAAATYPMTYPYYGANPGIPAAPYQESMSAMGLPMGAGIPPMPPVDMGNPPPLPPADKPPAPPPPPEEGELAKEPPLQDPYRGTGVVTEGPLQDPYSNRPPVQSGTSYGVPPPAIAKPQDDFNKPPPGGFENPGYRAQEGYQATKRSFDGDTYGRTADPHYPGPEDTKKPRPGGWEENRGGARGGRWGGGDATTPAPAPAKPASEPPPSTAGRDNPEELSEAEKAFDIQFKQWEDQFNSWKDQNINHPDKSQYREYEAKWESWREQLLQRREQMRKKREQSNASKAAGEVESLQSERSSSSSRGRSGRRGRGAGAAGYTDLKQQPAAQEDYREGSNRAAYGSAYERYPAGQEDPNSRVGGYVEPGLPQPGPNPPFDGTPTKAPESIEEKSQKDEGNNSSDQASKDPDPKPESAPESGKAERPLLEQPATPVNVPVEVESKTDETGGNFLKTSSGDGIPGLDLLADKAGVADKKDQELSVGFDVDDRAKVVEPGSDHPPASSFTLPPPNIPGAGQGTLNLPGMNQAPPNLSEMNQAPPNTQGYGPMYNNAPLNMQGFGSGGKQNIPGFGPPPKQGPPPNMQGYDFRHGSGNQGRNFGPNEDIKTNRQDLLSEGQRWNVGPGQEMEGYSSQEGQGRRPWEQQDRDRPRGNFGGGRDGFAGSGDNFGASKDNLLGSRDQYGGPRDNFGGPRDNFGGPRDNFGGTRDNFGRQRDNFGSLQDNFGKPKDNFGGPRDNFGNSQENFGGLKDNFGGLKDNFGGTRENFGGPRDNFGGSQDKFGGPRDSFGGPRDNFGGLRDNFGVSRDGFGGPRDSLGAPRDNFRVSRDNFDPNARDNIARFQDDLQANKDPFQSGVRGEEKDGNVPESSAEIPQDFEAPKDGSKDITGPKDVKDPIQRENLQGPHPREGLLGTPREGLLGTPKEGLLGTPREGILGTPKEGLLSTPREGLLGTPREGLLGTPREGLLGTPREGLLGTPREGLLGTPREGLLGTPREGLLGTPREGLLGTPREGLLATPRDNFPLRDNFPGMRGVEGPPFGGDMMRGGHQDFPFHEDNFRGRGGRGGRGVWQDRGRGRPPGPGGHYGKQDDTSLPLEDLEGRGNNWGPDGDYRDRWARRFDDGPPPTRGGWDHPRYPPNFPDRFDNPSRGPPSREEPLGWERGRPRGPPAWEREEEIVLEPATVVDYGHKPVTPVVKADLFETPVKTFDYGHGSGQRKPPGPDDWRKEESRTRDKDQSRNRWEDRDVGKTRWGRDKERAEEEERRPYTKATRGNMLTQRCMSENTAPCDFSSMLQSIFTKANKIACVSNRQSAKRRHPEQRLRPQFIFILAEEVKNQRRRRR